MFSPYLYHLNSCSQGLADLSQRKNSSPSSFSLKSCFHHCTQARKKNRPFFSNIFWTVRLLQALRSSGWHLHSDCSIFFLIYIHRCRLDHSSVRGPSGPLLSRGQWSIFGRGVEEGSLDASLFTPLSLISLILGAAVVPFPTKARGQNWGKNLPLCTLWLRSTKFIWGQQSWSQSFRTRDSTYCNDLYCSVVRHLDVVISSRDGFLKVARSASMELYMFLVRIWRTEIAKSEIRNSYS